ncbi:MAG: DNA-binding protein [Methanothrix sp.]|nr:MAG: DNA-binding protein [Methanothrix sp.]
MKRGREAIISQMLEICKKGACKTRIVYQANLNFRTVNPYINLLLEKELIEKKKGQTVLYETTEKGINLLDNLNHVNLELSYLSK